MNPTTFGRIVQAAGLSRIFRHLDEGPFAIVSAERGTMTPEENEQRTQDLKTRIRDLGFGFIPAIGMWEGAEENSLFIPDIPRDAAQGLSSMFDQDAFIWGDEGTYSVISTLGGNVYDSGTVKDRFHYLGKEEVDAPAYTEVKQRRFKLGTRRFTPNLKVGVSERGMRVGGKNITLSGFDLDRSGQLFFFWNGLDKFSGLIRTCGYAVHDDGPGRHLVYDDSGSFVNIELLKVYLPLRPS